MAFDPTQLEAAREGFDPARLEQLKKAKAQPSAPSPAQESLYDESGRAVVRQTPQTDMPSAGGFDFGTSAKQTGRYIYDNFIQGQIIPIAASIAATRLPAAAAGSAVKNIVSPLVEGAYQGTAGYLADKANQALDISPPGEDQAIAQGGVQGVGNSGGGGGTGNNQNENGFLSQRGRLVADERTNTLMISDIPKKIAQMRELISVIDRPVDQVLIEGRIVIATDSFARDLGAKFGLQGRRQGDRTQAIGGSLGGNTSIINDGVFVRDVEGDTATDGLNLNLPAGTYTTNPAASIAYTLLGRNFNLDIELSALQEEGRGEVISNPRLVTTNQREAVIKQGREVGYLTITGGGAGGGAATPTVQFKEALLELKVTPTITDDNRVFLNLNVKKDEVLRYITFTGFGAVPELARREINTAVLIEDGQTVVIGGVYEFSDRASVAKVPFLGDIPFLGNLFKKKGRSKEKAELLIFVTPKVLRVAERR